MPDQMIRLSDVTFSWSGRAAFDLAVPSLTVARGEKLFLAGQSGSGKSTLLSLICGIVAPRSGRVEIAGTDLTQLSGGARDRFRANHIGVIFQMFNLLPYASPLENILLPLAFAKQRRSATHDPKQEALRLTTALGLEDSLVLNAAASELSIGQQQRVAAARALIGGPKLIIADEPTSSLDAGSQSAFVKLLMDQVSALGATLIMVSHDTRLSQHFDRSLEMSDLLSAQEAGA